MPTKITIERNRIKKSFVLIAPPIPDKGDVVTVSGSDWLVVGKREVKVICNIPLARATKEFPSSNKANTNQESK